MACIRIERVHNGWSVELDDPKIVEARSKPGAEWKEANCEYAFEERPVLMAFLETVIDKALPEKKAPTRSFDDAYEEAITSAGDGDQDA